MKHRHLFSILLAFAMLCAALSGCGRQSAEQPTAPPPPTWRLSEKGDGMPPVVFRVGDNEYRPAGQRVYSIEIEDSEILGYLTYTGDLHIAPRKSGEGNFEDAEGAPYARSRVEEHPDGLMLGRPDGRWTLWLPDDDDEEPLDFIAGPDGSYPTVMKVEDTMYLIYTKLDPDIEIEDSEILGYLTYTGNDSLPRQNGECNYHGAEGAPYARYSLPRYPQCMVARLSKDQWWILIPTTLIES